MANDMSPMMKQHREIKQQHPDAILFFRVGDFYEMFHDDAVVASKILEIALTSRDKSKENGVPLCGIPFHAASGYIKKLIKAGYSVAICEQVEDPALAKGVLRREVLRVITPGTLIEPDLLAPKENNYVAALHWDPKRFLLSPGNIFGLAFLDLSTGAFQFCRAERFDTLEGVLNVLHPKEIVLSATLEEHPERLGPLQKWPLRYQRPHFFSESEAYALLRAHFKVHAVSALGEEGNDLVAAGALLAHVKEVQKGVIGILTTLQPYTIGETLRIHSLAQQHLHLVPEPASKEKTLLQILDQTVTAMGGRLFRHWLLNPLLSPKTISERQDAVAFFYQNPALRYALRECLQKMADTERVIGRIGLNAANPRDLVALKTSLVLLPEIMRRLHSPVPPAAIATLLTSWDNLEEVATLIDRALGPDPPLALKEGGVIQEGYRADLDQIRNVRKNGRAMLIEMEQAERKRTGIESLKIRYNQVFGYSIEVTETHRNRIPSDYIRKQTLARAERFTIASLMELESQLVGADETLGRLEAEIFEEICTAVSQQTLRIQEMTRKIAVLDSFLSLAEVAHQNRYVRPVVHEEHVLRILDGRHPVLEKLLPQFVPNDTFLGPSQLLLITGPNMAGKSTFMQQIALIVIMAQMGSFVPAREATIGVVDQIFARVGAADALSHGMSTFMMEMTEMAQILRQATARSFIVLDELGRGTSTFDGMSIAWAIAEHVYRLGARTVFATHYHELTRLAGIHAGIRNYHVRVREENETIIFLRKIVEGGADKSYGIEVARLAGLPAEIIKRAKEILAEIETTPSAHLLSGATPQAELQSTETPVSSEATGACSPLICQLREIDTHTLTPLAAICLLADLVEQAKKEVDPLYDKKDLL